MKIQRTASKNSIIALGEAQIFFGLLPVSMRVPNRLDRMSILVDDYFKSSNKNKEGYFVNIEWDSKRYTQSFDFVHKYGEAVMELIEAPAGSFVVDLGCGNGALSEKLISRGYRVLGLDASEEMLETARKLHPDIPFVCADAVEFKLEEKADVIFSNAVLHWIDAEKQDRMIANLASQLRPGGEFVCEFGGRGCAEAVHAELEKSFAKRGLYYPRVFYFPTIGEYAPILERHGFRVEYAILFDRPTKQSGEDGLRDWIHMFVKKPFEGMEESLQEEIIWEVVENLRGRLWIDGTWFVDYVRIRFRATKIGSSQE